MDDKAYTCFYCHSILPYDVCISGTHFCLQATNAIEFWGNVVKIASTNSVEEPDPPEGFNEDDPERRTFKQECQDEDDPQENLQDGEEAGGGFLEAECEDEDTSARHQPLPIKSAEDPVIDSQDGESDGVKPMNWRLKMIALVKQRPPLYDKRLPLTERTFPIRAKLWKEVYDGLNGLVPIDLLPKRFKVLRDRYNKEVKRRRLGHPPRKPWSLFKYLDFLSHVKKKICIKKMSLSGGEPRPEDCSEEKLSERLSTGEAPSALDDESYKENLEIKSKFVQLVGERPPLYDCRLPRSVRVAENKVKLWREVFQSLGGAIPLVDLPRKFKSLRDRYMKEKKKTEAGEGASSWPLMQHMSYLDDVAFIRSSQDSPLAPAAPPPALQSSLKLSEEKRCVEGLSLGGNGTHYDVEETMEVLHKESRTVPSSVQPRSLDTDIIVPDNLENHKELKESCEGLLNSLEHPEGTGGEEDIPGSERSTPDIASRQVASGSLSPASAFRAKGKGAEGGTGKLKKLDLIDRLDSWTEDDFFGAYLVKLMKKLPLEERLRLHIDIINMITASLKNCEKVPVPL